MPVAWLNQVTCAKGYFPRGELIFEILRRLSAPHNEGFDNLIIIQTSDETAKFKRDVSRREGKVKTEY